MQFDFEFLLQAVLGGLRAVPVTLEIAVLPVIFGTLLGVPVALLRFFEVKVISPILKWAVTIVRGIPVVLVMMYFLSFYRRIL